MLWLAITTAPRDSETLQDVIDSYGPDHDIHIFAEPWVTKPKNKNIIFHKNKKKQWCFGNWISTLKSMVDMKYDLIWINQDDMILEWYITTAISFMVSNPNAVVNFYTSIRQDQVQKTIYKQSRNLNNRWRNTRGISLMLTKEQAQAILNHPLTISHKLWYTKNQQLDSIISAVIKDLWYEHRYYNPSLTTHIGHKSTVEHADFYVNQRLQSPTEPIYWYVVWDHIPQDLYKHFDIIKLFSPDQEAEIIEAITHTPWYGFILSDKLAYAPDYVIQSIANLKKIWNSVLSYRYYTINSQGIEEKAAHIFNNDTKQVQFSHYWAIAFYWRTIRDKQPKQLKDNLSYTLSILFQDNNIQMMTAPHTLWTINYLSTDPQRYDTDTILKDRRHLIY